MTGKLIAVLLLLLSISSAYALEIPGVGLPAMHPEPFKISDVELSLTSETAAEVRFTITAAAGYFLYRDEVELSIITPDNVRLVELSKPAGGKMHDNQMVLEGVSSFTAKLALGDMERTEASPLRIDVAYRGCTKDFCLHPQTERLLLDLDSAQVADHENEADEETELHERYGVFSLPTIVFTDSYGNEFYGERIHGFVNPGEMAETINRVAAGEASTESVSTVEQMLGQRGAIAALFAFFVFGILISLTPCVWPMVPITAGIVLGSKKPGTFAGALLAGSYVIGMAASYAAMGLIVATAGGMIGGLLQHPAVLVLVSLMFVAMALSMFGLYEIPMITIGSGKRRGGGVAAVFGLGAASALVLSPCVGPVLAGLLSFVAIQGNKLLGSGMLFMYGLGMGLPLVVLGGFSGALQKMPRAGSWMLEIKKSFGIVMLALAVYFLLPVFGAHASTIAAAAAAALGIGVLIFDVRRNRKGILPKGKIALSVVLITFGVYSIMTPAPAGDSIQWYESFEEAREIAIRENMPMMLDFTAEWCSVCKRLERETLSHPSVIEAAGSVVPVKVDLTSVR